MLGDVGVIDLRVAGQQAVHHRDADAGADVARQACRDRRLPPLAVAASVDRVTTLSGTKMKPRPMPWITPTTMMVVCDMSGVQPVIA